MRAIVALLALVVGVFALVYLLGARPKPPAPNPALAYKGTPPAAITLHPMVGEDMARPTAIFPVEYPNVRMFLRGGPRLDADMTSWAPIQYNDSPAHIAEIAALLELVEHDPGTEPCDPGKDAVWPPNWRVRFYDADGKVMRDFSVPVRLVRCRASKHQIESLARLGADLYSPEGNAPTPPQRLSPEGSRAALLALARGPEGQPRTSTLTVSLAEPRGVLIHLGAPGLSQAGTVVMKDPAFRAMLEAGLEHPAVVAGMNRSALSQAESYTFRVLQSYEGMRNPILVFSAHVTKLEMQDIVNTMRSAIAASDPKAARRIGSIAPR